MNQSFQDYQVKLADPGAAITEWHLSFAEMSDQELAALEALFQATEGRLTPFTFLDPADNLLAWSEQQNQAVWQADPLLTLTGGVADPMGGTAAFQVSNPRPAMTAAAIDQRTSVAGLLSEPLCAQRPEHARCGWCAARQTMQRDRRRSGRG